jgi:hypothetical protein
MRLTVLGSERRWPAETRSRPGPSIDRFGTSVSVVVLAVATAAVLLVRQNLDDHVYRLADGTAQAETTGAATSR